MTLNWNSRHTEFRISTLLYLPEVYLKTSDLEILNSVINILYQTQVASKGSMGKLMGDKAELVMLAMADGVLAKDNNPGYDLIGQSFIPELDQGHDCRYEVKLRRKSVTACNFDKSKMGKFDIGIVIWYNPENLQPFQAYALSHDVIEKLCHSARAHITPKVCREQGYEFTGKLKEFW